MPTAKGIMACSTFSALFLVVSLHTATGMGKKNVQPRAKQRAVLNLQERHRLNVLLSASASRTDSNYARFRELVKQGADPNTRDYLGGRPYTKEDSTTWLIEFSALGDTQTVKTLLDNGAKVNARGQTCFRAMGHGEPDPRNSTALIDACCRTPNWDIIQLLLQHGAHVNVRDNSGNTPLGMAEWQSDGDVCRLLLRHGARPELMHKWERESLKAELNAR